MKAVIMAGGQGSRLWPLSDNRCPKHLLDLLEEGTLLAAAWRRVLRVVPAADVVTVTNNQQYAQVAAAAQALDPALKRHVISEPVGRNTAGALALAGAYLSENCRLDPREMLLVCPADQLLEPADRFAELVDRARVPASRGFLVTFGVKPREAHTGYGYIEAGEKRDGFLLAARFVEKPGLETARRYCQSGRHFWNAGIFAFESGVFLAALRRHAPEFAALADAGYQRARAMFDRLPAISIDYALMEKADQVAVVPVSAPFSWSDVGSWDALYSIREKDAAGNVTSGPAVVALDAFNSLLFSSGRKLAVIGVDNVTVIETPEAVLVLGRGHEQKVRDIQGWFSGKRPSSPDAVRGIGAGSRGGAGLLKK